MQQNKLILWVVLGGVLSLVIVSGAAYFLTRMLASARTAALSVAVAQPTTPVNTESPPTTVTTTPPVTIVPEVSKKTPAPILTHSAARTPADVVSVAPQVSAAQPTTLMPELRFIPTTNNFAANNSTNVVEKTLDPFLSHSATGTVLITSKGLTLIPLPPSPIWASLTNNVTEAFNNIQFDYRFTSPAEGLLSVFIDDQVVFKADQRYAEAGVNHSGPISVGTVALGQHVLSFRLDFFTSAQSSVEITDIVPSNTSIVYVTNQKPIASAGATQEVHLGSLTYLDGSASYDPDKKPLPLTYNWKQISGPEVLLFGPTHINPKFTPTTKGTYVFSLKVNDGQSYSNTSTVSVNAL